MSIERFIWIAVAAFSIGTVFYIPRSQYRLAVLSFITFQFITWAGSILVVQIGLIEFPVREFPKATRAGFIPNFLFIPILFTWFILLFPHRSAWVKKMVHYFLFVSVIVWFICFIAVYTDLENFKKWTLLINVFLLYLRVLIYFGCCHLYISWFAKKENLSPGVNQHVPD